MSALFHSPLSAPAVRVEVETDHGTERFSRTLSDRNPHTRSSTAQIVPMGGVPSVPACDWVLYIVGVVALAAIWRFA